jgi:hypothetical protein
MILKWDARPSHVSVVRVLDGPRILDAHEMRREPTVEKPLNDMLIGPGQEKTAAAARSLVIWGEELSRKRRYAAAERLYLRAAGLVERTWGQHHPMMAEVLECYADLLVRTNRADEGIAMRSRSEAIWRAYIPRFCRTYKEVHPLPVCWVEREGSD